MIHGHVLPHSLVQGIDLAGMILLAGGSAFRALVISAASREVSRLERCLPFFLIAVGLADLVLRSQMITGRHGSEVLSLLPTVLLKTHFGNVWMGRTLLLLLLGMPMVRNRAGLALPTCALLLLTESLSGHAADSGTLSAAVLADWLHLAAVSVWMGGLFFLASALRRWFASASSADSSEFLRTVKRFSKLAGLCVAVIAATGGFQFWHRVGSVAALLQTPYGQTLTAKLVLVLALLSLGALNRYVIVPKLSSVKETSRKLSKTVVFEIGLALAVLVCVAILLQLPPARSQLESEYKASGHPADHRVQGEAPRTRPAPAEGASVKILAPKDGEVFSADQVPVRFQLVKGKRGGTRSRVCGRRVDGHVYQRQRNLERHPARPPYAGGKSGRRRSRNRAGCKGQRAVYCEIETDNRRRFGWPITIP